MNTGIRTMAGNLTTNLSVSNSLNCVVISNDNTANKNLGMSVSETKIPEPKGNGPPTIETITNPRQTRLHALVRRTSQKLRWPKPDVPGLFGIIFRGPTLRKFVRPYEALMTDVMNATELIALPSPGPIQ